MTSAALDGLVRGSAAAAAAMQAYLRVSSCGVLATCAIRLAVGMALLMADAMSNAAAMRRWAADTVSEQRAYMLKKVEAFESPL